MISGCSVELRTPKGKAHVNPKGSLPHNCSATELNPQALLDKEERPKSSCFLLLSLEKRKQKTKKPFL